MKKIWSYFEVSKSFQIRKISNIEIKIQLENIFLREKFHTNISFFFHGIPGRTSEKNQLLRINHYYRDLNIWTEMPIARRTLELRRSTQAFTLVDCEQWIKDIFYEWNQRNF